MIKENLIIMGSGCAGLTAAIYASRANLNPLVFEGAQPGGQLTVTSDIENFPGFPNGINGYELMDNMKLQAKKFGTKFISYFINKVLIVDKHIIIQTSNNVFQTKALIIATGASSKMLGLNYEKELLGKGGVTTCATCDGPFYKNMVVVVIGGGDSACEQAMFLTKFCTKIYLIHRRNTLRASKIMSNRVLNHKKIQIVWNTNIISIIKNNLNKVKGIIIKNNNHHNTTNIECQGIFVAIGHSPNTKLFNNILNIDSKGYIITNNKLSTQTNISGIFAAGDCVDYKYRQAITAAGMGCQAALEAEDFLNSF